MKRLLLILAISLSIVTNAFGATRTWSGATNNNWSNAGNWDTKPANGDDVIINNSVNCIVDEATANLKSFDMTGYTGTLSGSSAITVVGAASSTVDVKFAGTITWTGTLNLNPAATTTNIQLTSNGKTFASLTAGGAAGKVYILDALSLTGNLNSGNGTAAIHLDGLTDNAGLSHTIGGWYISLNNPDNFGASTVNFTGAGSNFFPRNGGTFSSCSLTFSAATYSGTNHIQTDNYGFTIGTVNANGAGDFHITNNGAIQTVTIGTLNRAGSTAKTDGLVLNSNVTITGTFNIDGNSGVNRMLITSRTLGTQRTLTLTGATISGCTNVDFRDIAFVSTGAVDFSGITGGSGDCGGNTISGGGALTFTTADDWYWQTTGAGTYNMEDNTHWYTATNGGGTRMDSDARNAKALLPQDNAFFDGSSVSGATTVDQNEPRVCKTLDFTGVGAMNFHMNNVSQTIYGGLVFTGTEVVSYSGAFSITFEGRSSYNFAGSDESMGETSIIFNGVGGTITLTRNLGGGNLSHGWGTFNTDIYNMSVQSFSSTSSNARTLLLGSGTHTINQTTGGWSVSTTGLTSTNIGGTSTIIMAGQHAVGNLFAGGGCTYNNLIENTVTAGNFHYISGSNTFNILTITAPNLVKFTAGTTTNVSSLVATGDAGNLIHIDSTSASAATLSDTTGTNTVHYCHIGETGAVNATGGATWDATDNCNVNSSTGWTTTSATTGFMTLNSKYW